MAGPLDPFTPGPTSDPTAGVADPDTFNNIRNQWSTFIDQPGNRAFLLQTGLALMRTPRFGQGPMDQIGDAVGEGAEALTRGRKLDIAESEAASKQDLRGAQAEAAIARSGTAATNVELARERFANDRIKAQFASQTKLDQIYQTYLQNAQKENADAVLFKRPPTPILSKDEWLNSSAGAAAIRQAGMLTGTEPQARSAQDAAALKWANENPSDPRAAQIKQRLGQ
jgi:hypothetical protein